MLITATFSRSDLRWLYPSSDFHVIEIDKKHSGSYDSRTGFRVWVLRCNDYGSFDDRKGIDSKCISLKIVFGKLVYSTK